MEEMFFSEQDELTGRFVVIDEIEKTIWAYLTFPFEERIDKDCFLISRHENQIEEFNLEEYKKKKNPPPMINEFASLTSWMPNLAEEQIDIEWKNGNPIIKINQNPYLLFTKLDKRGFSKSISKSGRYGNKWNQTKYDEIFK